VMGAPLRAMGRPTWRRPRLFGLINPFCVPGFVVERDGARYFARPGTYLGQDGLRHAVRFRPGAYEPEISYPARALVRDGEIGLDTGANVGPHSVAFARLAGSGHGYAVEPVTEMAEQLSANWAFNGIENVAVIGCALGDREETLAMEVNIAGDGLEGTSTLAGTVHVERHPENYETRQVQVRRLDDVMNALDIDGRIGFVKIDTEGFETLVIEGGLETLRRHRPKLVMEFWPYGLKHAGESPAQVLELLTGLGYRLRNIDELCGLLTDTSPEQLLAAYPDTVDYGFTNLLATVDCLGGLPRWIDSVD